MTCPLLRLATGLKVYFMTLYNYNVYNVYDPEN